MAQFGSFSFPFTDFETFILNNCIPVEGVTNGQDLNNPSAAVQVQNSSRLRFKRPQRSLSPQDRRRHRNAIADSVLTDADLPSRLTPQNPLSNTGPIPFFQLPDGKTGALALNSFELEDFDSMEQDLLTGLQQLKANGATRIIIDLVSR